MDGFSRLGSLNTYRLLNVLEDVTRKWWRTVDEKDARLAPWDVESDKEDGVVNADEDRGRWMEGCQRRML